MKAFLFVFALTLTVAPRAFANGVSTEEAAKNAPNILDELDPTAPDIERQLEQFDAEQEEMTGQPSWLEPGFTPFSACYRASCMVWARVVKSQQTLYLYVDGQPHSSWAVSTGIPGRETPRFDQHPDGRVYDAYMSKSFPGGNYKGLGNMPYAVFIRGGYALHGTPQSNWPHLGRKASHGCIRMHPDNAYLLNRLVRQYGPGDVWITVE